MGNYATNAQLQEEFSGTDELVFLTDNEAAGTVDTDRLDACIESAEAEINSYLATRYATPVDVSLDTELNRLLNRKTIDLAVWYVYGRADHISDAVGLKREQVLEWCREVRKGNAVLTGAITSASTASRNPLATWSDTSRTQPSDSGRLITRSSMGRL